MGSSPRQAHMYSEAVSSCTCVHALCACCQVQARCCLLKLCSNAHLQHSTPHHTAPLQPRCFSFLSQLVGVAVGSSPRQARVYDLTTGEVIATLDEAAAAAAAAGTAGGASGGAAGAAGGGAAAGGGEFVRGAASACFSPSGEYTLCDMLHVYVVVVVAAAGGGEFVGGQPLHASARLVSETLLLLKIGTVLRSVGGSEMPCRFNGPAAALNWFGEQPQPASARLVRTGGMQCYITQTASLVSKNVHA